MDTTIPSIIISFFFNSSPLLLEFLFVGSFYHICGIFTFFFQSFSRTSWIPISDAVEPLYRMVSSFTLFLSADAAVSAVMMKDCSPIVFLLITCDTTPTVFSFSFAVGIFTAPQASNLSYSFCASLTRS